MADDLEFIPDNPFDLAARMNGASAPSHQEPQPPAPQSTDQDQRHIGVQEPRPYTYGTYAQQVNSQKGDYFSHDNKAYSRRDGKTYLLTGDPIGDVELDADQTAQLEKSRSELTRDTDQPKLTPLSPILHPMDTYRSIADRRRYYQDFYPGEKYSDQRHATMSYWLTKEIGPNWTDLMGIGNEIQGLIRWDLPQLGSRLRGESPWAFQLQDIEMNRRGIGKALVDMMRPDGNGGPPNLMPPSDGGSK